MKCSELRRPVGVISLSDIAQLDQGQQAAKVLSAIASREVRI